MKRETLLIMAAMLLVAGAAMAAIIITPPGLGTWPDGSKMFREIVDVDYFGTPVPEVVQCEIHARDEIVALVAQLDSSIAQLYVTYQNKNAKRTKLLQMLHYYPTPTPAPAPSPTP